MYVFTYLPSILLYSINVQNPTSEYFHIREYSDIRMIVSRILWHFYEHVTNVFNIRAIVSIGTKLYMRKIRTYGIEYFSGMRLLAHVGHALLVHYLISPNTLLGCLILLWVWHPDGPTIFLYIVLSFDLQTVLLLNNYRMECNIHGYQGWYYKNDEIEIPVVGEVIPGNVQGGT